MINVQSNNIARGGGQAAGVVSKEYRIPKDDTYVSSLFLTAATKPDNIIKVRRSLKKTSSRCSIHLGHGSRRLVTITDTATRMCSGNEFGATIVKHFLSAREANIGAKDLKREQVSILFEIVRNCKKNNNF